VIPVPAIYLAQRGGEFRLGVADSAGYIALGKVEDGAFGG
jgi:hypothetical protein